MEIKNIDVKTLNNWLENDQAILIDVREPAEHRAQKIKQAQLIPLSDISCEILPKGHNKKIVVHCASGNRSNKACQKLLDVNPDLELYNLEGGIKKWSELGYHVESAGKAVLPLDRQVQLTAGLLILLFSVLSLVVSSSFALVTCFMGCGLIFAGLTGTCAMASLLAKMPWNK